LSHKFKFLICTFSFLSLNLYSYIDNYIYPNFEIPSYSNYGSLGLIQNPNARFHEEGTLGFSWSHNEPYLRGSIMAYPFNWFEASFQYTDINNQLYSLSKAFSGSQSLKDKSFDAKFRILSESSTLPQVAVGFRDIGGTGLFGSEYLVMSKKLLKNLDFTFGIGWGNLNGNKLKNPLAEIHESFKERNSDQGLGGKVNVKDFFSGDAGYFAGIEYVLPFKKGIRFKLELDGTNYETESTIPLTQEYKVNFGIVYPLTQRFHTKLFFTRGDTVNFGFSYQLALSKKNPMNIKKVEKVKLERADIIKDVVSRSKDNLYRASLLYLKQEKLSLQKATAQEEELHVAVSHSVYRNPALAVGRTINIIDQIAPDNIKTIKVSEVNAGLGMYTASVSRDAYKRYKNINQPEVLGQYISTEPFNFDEKSFEFNPTTKYPAVFNSMGPEIISQIGGPDGFFFGDLKWNANSEILFSRNISLVSAFSYGIYDNMDELKLESDSILPRVRTDIVKYLKQSRGLSIKRMQLTYYDQISSSTFFRFSGGIFESMFGGYGGEILYRPHSKNYGISVEAWRAHQREYNQRFKFRDYNTITGHINFYYQEPSTNILIHLKGGRYLAKDSGITVDLSRVFRSGVKIGGFFTLTDISAAEFGEGSFDKGFYFWVPVEIFSPRHFKRTFGWGLRPITRDGGQSLIYGYPLWGVTDGSNGHHFRRRIDEIYE